MKKFVIGLLIVFALAACTGGSPASVQGQWKLVSYGSTSSQTPAVSDVDTSIEFKDGALNGNVGCNSFGGNYEVSADQIKFEPIASTLMECGDPIGSQESGVFAVLYDSATIVLDGNTLTITSADGNSVVVLERK